MYILFLGIYVFRIPKRKKIQTVFLYFCALLSIWIASFSVRQFVSMTYRQHALDWMLIPTIFFPILLDRIVSLIEDENHKVSKLYFGINFAFVVYFLWAAITCSYSVIEDKETFAYTSTIHYHLLMFYIVIYGSFSLSKLARNMLNCKGNQRVRFTLLMMGVLNLLVFAGILLYVLPIYGIFYGYLISISVLLSASLWSISILQYNAFEIKAAMLSGGKVPYLNRITLNFYLTLFRHLDPNEFRDKSVALKTALTTDMLYTDMNLVFN
ncbi:LIC10906 family membrane protein, partial [Leptospira alstonii]|uniref:LIC10906 family membrane protein n=1 Tax=Leptospira alstonii TaxID=28452 RepID=UPI003B8486EC